MTASPAKEAVAIEPVAPKVHEILLELLGDLADCEALFTERFYPIFFALRPDVRPLFGVHSMAEQEEMMHETLHSLHAWLENEPWLAGNLEALGRSHWEYGVTDDMYDSFMEAMIACGREIMRDSFDKQKEVVLRSALDAAFAPMRAAGIRAAAAERRRHSDMQGLG